MKHNLFAMQKDSIFLKHLLRWLIF